MTIAQKDLLSAMKYFPERFIFRHAALVPEINWRKSTVKARSTIKVKLQQFFSQTKGFDKNRDVFWKEKNLDILDKIMNDLLKKL